MIDLQAASRTILGICILFVFLLAIPLAVLDPGSESYVVAQLALIPILISLVAAVVIIYVGWTPFK